MSNFASGYVKYINHLEQINDAAVAQPARMIREVEDAYHDHLENIARNITGHHRNVRVIMLSGPSSSGKTTTAKLLRDFLTAYGASSHIVSLDDFYRGVGKAPKLPGGGYNYESVEALDVESIKRCLLDIIATGEFSVPRYDFALGRPNGEPRRYRIGPRDMVIVEGIHGLNPLFTKELPEDSCVKLYVSVKQQIKDANGEVFSPMDLRLVRRIVRDIQAGPTIWQAIRSDLGGRAPYAVEVEGACEDQGIRVEAVSALADSRLVRIYFTARDLEGNRLDENTEVTYSLSLADRGTWPYRNYRVTQLSYDPETGRALFVITATGREGVSDGDTFRLNVESLLGGHRPVLHWSAAPSSNTDSITRIPVAIGEDGTLDWAASGEALTTPAEGFPITGELLPSTWTEDGAAVLLPQPEREQAIDSGGDYSIAAAGFAADGNLHVRVRPAPDAVWEDVEVSAMILKDDGAAVGRPLEKITPVDGDLDYCLEGFGPAELPLLTEITVMGDYSTLTDPVEGDWTLEIPLRAVEGKTIPLSLELPAAQASDGFITAERLELSPLSLTLVCDQDSMYPEDGKTLRSTALEELTPSVTLADGTVLSPSYADSDSWWACWIFDRPIDPEDVELVSINGETVPLS